MQTETDVLIIGGGIAGCIAAISLSEQYKVTLIDKLSEPKERIGECLAPAARRILKQLGLNPELHHISSEKDVHLVNLGTTSYWGSSHPHIVDHLRNPDGFGWYLNRKAFEIYLRKEVEKRGVQCIWPTQLYSTLFKDNKWLVKVKNGLHTQGNITMDIQANFVIDSSGRSSVFTRKQGIKRSHTDKLISCWATMPDFEANKMGIISSCKNGWWYTSPLPNNKRVLAFQTDSDLLELSKIRTNESFIELTKSNKEISALLKNHESTIQYKGIVSANSTRLNQVTGPQWAALGDAAISFDPLSSQGMFNAMANAMQLSGLIKAHNLIHHPTANTVRTFNEVYTYQIDQVWNHFLNHKHIFYRQEQRWINAPFWQRRHEIAL